MRRLSSGRRSNGEGPEAGRADGTEQGQESQRTGAVPGGIAEVGGGHIVNIGDETGMYKGFLIVELPGEPVRAYRSKMYLDSNITSYETPDRTSLEDAVDKAGDHGEFTPDQYRELTGKEPEITPTEELRELIKGLPFVPEPGPPLPEYVHEAIQPGLVSSIMKPPSSDYGRTLTDKVALDMSLFLKGGDFEIVEKLEETGWASDSVAWDAKIKHVPTNTEWDIEVWANFKWRKPEEIESSFLDFLPAGAQITEDKWEIMPEEEWSDSSFDIATDEGKKAGEIITEYVGRT